MMNAAQLKYQTAHGITKRRKLQRINTQKKFSNIKTLR